MMIPYTPSHVCSWTHTHVLTILPPAHGGRRQVHVVVPSYVIVPHYYVVRRCKPLCNLAYLRGASVYDVYDQVRVYLMTRPYSLICFIYTSVFSFFIIHSVASSSKVVVIEQWNIRY